MKHEAFTLPDEMARRDELTALRRKRDAAWGKYMRAEARLGESEPYGDAYLAAHFAVEDVKRKQHEGSH